MSQDFMPGYEQSLHNYEYDLIHKETGTSLVRGTVKAAGVGYAKLYARAEQVTVVGKYGLENIDTRVKRAINFGQLSFPFMTGNGRR